MRVFLAVVLLVWTGMHIYVFWRASSVPRSLATFPEVFSGVWHAFCGRATSVDKRELCSSRLPTCSSRELSFGRRC